MNEKKLINRLILNIKKQINTNKNIISISFVGSIDIKNNFNEISDIDVVVIVKNLNLNLFYNIKKSVNEINLSKLGIKNRILKINSKFGPLKFNNNKNIVIHLMIYDLEKHYNHVYNSPFTCFDWERSKKFFGKKLSKIYPVRQIQPVDFLKSRRGIRDYIRDLNKGILSYREYNFTNNKIKEVKKNIKISKKIINEFAFHILRFLFINEYKLETQKNILIPNKVFDKKIREYSHKKDAELNIYNYNYIKKLKYDSQKNFPNWTLVWIKNFVNDFNKKFKLKWDNTQTIYFIRHFKSIENKRNTFLGAGRNPPLIDTDKIKINKYLSLNPEIVYSSKLKRAYQTARLIFKNKKIIKNKLINEIDYGFVEGINIDELYNHYPKLIRAWKSKQDPKFPKGENTKSVIKRLNNFINNFIKNNNKSSAIITHNVVIRCLIGQLFNLPLSDYYKIRIKHGQVIEIKIINGKLYPNINRSDLVKIFKNIDLI